MTAYHRFIEGGTKVLQETTPTPLQDSLYPASHRYCFDQCSAGNIVQRVLSFKSDRQITGTQ